MKHKVCIKREEQNKEKKSWGGINKLSGSSDVPEPEYEDLMGIYKECKSPQEFLKLCWENSNKNDAAYNYMSGAIDALRFAKELSHEEYSDSIGGYIYNYGKG